jgi:mannan endo-1,4-beta-mannosidase
MHPSGRSRFAAALIAAACCATAFVACRPAPNLTTDPDATPETRALLANLHRLADEGRFAFGHQDATAYGVGWRPEPSDDAASLEARADVFRVTGQLPGVYGWGVDDVTKSPDNIDSVRFERIRELAIRAYERGAVNIFSWHGDNPVSGGNTWDTTRAVRHILPGGSHHEAFRAQLAAIADFFDRFETGSWPSRTKVPVIFRPYHEHTGSWFWWGKTLCTPSEFVALWQFTVDFMRKERGLHHVLFSYSPDRFDERREYLERYPGDAYVDILGFDDYYDFYGEGRSPEMFADQLRIVTQLASERGKVAALTETGLETIPDSTWYTDVLLKHIRTDSLTNRIAFAMVWRNAYQGHHYVPYPGHPAEANFREFAADPNVLMESELPRMYSIPNRR